MPFLLYSAAALALVTAFFQARMAVRAFTRELRSGGVVVELQLHGFRFASAVGLAMLGGQIALVARNIPGFGGQEGPSLALAFAGLIVMAISAVAIEVIRRHAATK